MRLLALGVCDQDFVQQKPKSVLGLRSPVHFIKKEKITCVTGVLRTNKTRPKLTLMPMLGVKDMLRTDARLQLTKYYLEPKITKLTSQSSLSGNKVHSVPSKLLSQSESCWCGWVAHNKFLFSALQNFQWLQNF